MKTLLQDRDTNSSILDFFARLFVHDERYIEILLSNPSAEDSTFIFLAAELKQPQWLDMISFNQVRYIRCPDIIETMFYNPETKMSAVSRMLETAARNNLNWAIPGFREVQALILGEEELKKKRDAGEISSQEYEELVEVQEEGEGIDDDEFQNMLEETSDEVQAPEAEEEEEEKVPLWRAISNMKAAQKVRLAILGNASARKILIRDPKKVVSMAVLRSPRLTDKEVAYFATQKSLSEEVIRMIAKNREWTRHYSTKVALVKNPKTPTQQSMWFLKSLHLADLKALARDRDVPGVIMKSAKRMVDQKTSGRKAR